MRATQSEEEEWVRRGHVMKTIMFPGLKSPEKIFSFVYFSNVKV